MTTFIRLLGEKDKQHELSSVSSAVRLGSTDERIFDISPASFELIPGAPFAYWVSDKLRSIFKDHSAFECDMRTAKQGLATADDGRFLRVWWECNANAIGSKNGWIPLVKGGTPEKFFTDPYAVVKWHNDGFELKSFASSYRASRGWGDQWSAMINATEYYFRPGFTWPLRASVFAPSAMPTGCAFSTRGCAGIVPINDLPWLIALMSSSSFDYIFKLRLGRFGYPEFSSGALQPMPVPNLDSKVKDRLSELFRSAWSRVRTSYTVDETSHAFSLPAALRARLGAYNPVAMAAELVDIQTEIDSIAFDAYGFSDADCAAALAASGSVAEDTNDGAEAADNSEEEGSATAIDQTDGLLSWCAGVAFGRFDIRLALGERELPPDPGPFDPLPSRSLGMLPDGDGPFHHNAGILVDDLGHPHDLVQKVESVLERVDLPTPDNVRRWLQKDFFKEHLKKYSKIRRKAPIYWPLATASSSYTLWIYYPDFGDQTLYTAVNDFLEPKLKLVGDELNSLRAKSNRSAVEERELEKQQDLEQDLIELHDAILEIAPTYKPNHDDGVQITAAPLWPLFRHKPWQKVLKQTWEKLEAGEYDWAHLAFSYWPDRVREKCKTDKSLAIAQGLEELYEEPAA